MKRATITFSIFEWDHLKIENQERLFSFFPPFPLFLSFSLSLPPLLPASCQHPAIVITNNVSGKKGKTKRSKDLPLPLIKLRLINGSCSQMNYLIVLLAFRDIHLSIGSRRNDLAGSMAMSSSVIQRVEAVAPVTEWQEKSSSPKKWQIPTVTSDYRLELWRRDSSAKKTYRFLTMPFQSIEFRPAWWIDWFPGSSIEEIEGEMPLARRLDRRRLVTRSSDH